jgi:hypothetical protein
MVDLIYKDMADTRRRFKSPYVYYKVTQILARMVE